MTARTRALSVFAAGALITPLVMLGSPAFAAGEATPPPPRSVADLCANVPADFEPFSDIDGNTFEDNIECLAFAEITQGQSGGSTYGPGGSVRRGQMASFIARLIDAADELDTGDNIRELPAFDGVVTFTDVTPGNVHRENIDRLAEAGIVNGGPEGRPRTMYGPELEVSRAQMASFIKRALEYMTGESFDTTDDYFTDDETSTHQRNINAVAALAIAVGDGRDTYSPIASVTRGQMAGFLTRTLAVLEEDGKIRPVGEEAPGEPGQPNQPGQPSQPPSQPSPPAENIQVIPDSEVILEAVANPDTNTSDDRDYNVTGLVAGEEYRITVLEAGTVQGSGQSAVFTDSDNDNLAEVGDRTADITEVNGAAPRNNTGDGTTATATAGGLAQTAVFTAGAERTATFTIDGDENDESVRPVVYRNGGPGNADDDGGQSPRLELNDDGTAAEAFDLGGVIVFQAEGTLVTNDVTDAPDLVDVEFVRTVDNDDNPDNDNSRSTFRFTFDESIGTTVVARDFHLISFRGDRFDGDLAQRDPDDEAAVLVVFNENSFNTSTINPDRNDDFRAAEIDDLTVGTVDADAVEDAGATGNPIGSVPLGSGISFTAGDTAAPDLESIGNFRGSPTSGTEPPAATLVDFTFDEEAFVVDPTLGQFQLILLDGQELEGTPEDNTSTTASGDFRGEGTTTLTVRFQNVDRDGTAGNDPVTAGDVARGVILADTVSDAEQVDGRLDPITGEAAEGNTNPLQVTDTNAGGATTLPDLVSASPNTDDNTVTYTFDEDVVVATATAPATRFQFYDSDGNQFEGTGFSSRDTDGDDAVVIVQFGGQGLEAAVGASVDDNAVFETTAGGGRGNQEDEVGVDSPDIAAGRTVGPDLIDVTRQVTTSSSTDPITGEVTTRETGVTIRFVFDDEAALAENLSGMTIEEFTVVSETGERTVLEGCEQEDGAVGDENVVACRIPANDDATTPDIDESEQFEAARNGVLGTVDDESVEDDEGEVNPEGARPITERPSA
jgi:hypothetical protein